MGEIDTNPIESVQNAVSFFGQINHEQRKINTERDQKESEKENELEILTKHLANAKLQLEAKDSAYKQILLKLDHQQKTTNELSTLLKNSDYKKEFYINEFQEAKVRINELESAMNQMVNKLSESEKLQEQLSLVNSHLVSTQGQILEMETEISVLREEKADSVTRAEKFESALGEEKMKTEELVRNISHLNEMNFGLKTKVIEKEREKVDVLLEKRSELESARKAGAEAEEKLKLATKRLEFMQDLENQLVDKLAYIGSLEIELEQVTELKISSEKALSDAISEVNLLKEDMGFQDKKNFDQSTYIGLLETELKQLRTELGNVKEDLRRSNDESERVKSELDKTKEQENDAQVEIAMLNFELHKGRSKLAATEAAEARAQSEKSALFNALQEMGLEIEEAKKENRVLKEAIKLADQSKNSSSLVEESMQKINDEESKTESEEKQLVLWTKNVEKGENPFQDSSNENAKELENLKKELEVATSKIGEFRNRAEQAISRAEAAEKGKAALEVQMKKLKEHKERRKAALAALREESVSRDFISNGNSTSNSNSSTSYDHSVSVKNYQPLGKVLNMKF